METWITWGAAGLLVLSTLVKVGSVGKPRNPLTPGDAVVAVVLNTALILGVLYLGGVL